MKKVKIILVLTLAVSFAIAMCGCGDTGSSDSPIAKASTGTYVGQDNDGVQEFLGIRYGEFTPYKPASDVTTTEEDEIQATEWGANCIQPYDEVEDASKDPCSQDCLFLNVWTKDTETKDKPVIVWIHGGSYIWGGTTDPLYHGGNFVRNLPEGEDCVFVTLNYRLSIMGGLDLSSLDGYTDEYSKSWNLSKLDQTQALKWVNENIEAFGGDTENITVMGHSSGGAAVQMLMADPDSNKYFNRVIENSGVQNQVSMSDELFKENSKKVLQILGVKSVDELVNLTDEQISDKMIEINESVSGIGNRAADGDVISETWWDDLKEGSAKDIDLFIGSVNGEEDWDSTDWDKGPAEAVTDYRPEYNSLKKSNEKYAKTYGRLLPFKQEGIVESYMNEAMKEGQSDVMAIQSLVNDMAATYPSLLAAEAQSKWNDNVYMYYWEYAPDKDEVVEYMGDEAEVSPWNRALHSMDVNFEFGNIEDGYTNQTGDPAKVPMDLVTKMQSAVYNFAKTGNPNNENIPEWKAYNENSQATMVIGLDTKWNCEKNYRGDLMDILKKVRPYGEK